MSKYTDGKYTEAVDWSLVDFTHTYTLTSVPSILTQAWVSHYELKNTRTGRVYKLSPPIPTPIIIYGSDMYIPTDFINKSAITQDTMFDHYVLK